MVLSTTFPGTCAGESVFDVAPANLPQQYDAPSCVTAHVDENPALAVPATNGVPKGVTSIDALPIVPMDAAVIRTVPGVAAISRVTAFLLGPHCWITSPLPETATVNLR